MARVFPASQIPLLEAVLSRLIPPSSEFPGAGDLGLSDELDRVTGRSTATRRMFVEGMQQIVLESERRHARSFAELEAAEQDAVLRQVEGRHAAFFLALVSLVYQGYYSHPTVVRLLGLEARPPQPIGHGLPPFDPAMIRTMSERRAIYRQP